MASLDDTTDPSGRLITASQVQGTAVYDTKLEKLGRVEDVMIQKASGRIAYAILTFGGFLGIGDRYYPLPWDKLRYDTELGGYVVDIDRETVEGAPAYSDQASTAWTDVDTYYAAHSVMP